ncbi:hypothetical protein L1987_22718 [Smallanthus sonchifolius]|uniref:Uncharacterized protein n=1 Tax=Smallanthus sonchifolius TaxID=185202 RepID=A0ACB9IGJ7_9ASTR|nr:hypothetical protein L1987_22718 [Smallanthus sonchifolius]
MQEPWKLFTDGASNDVGCGAGLMLISPEGIELTYALRLNFKSTNNEAEYEALLAVLRMAKEMKVVRIEAHFDFMLVANQVNNVYEVKGEAMKQYRAKNKKVDALSKFASVAFNHLAKEIRMEVLAEPSTTEKSIESVEAEKDKTWMSPLLDSLIEGILLTDKGEARKVQRLVWENIVCRFGIPRELVSDNGKQFAENPFKHWCTELQIKQVFSSVKHPQSNGQVERANRSLVEGIKNRLEPKSYAWLKEIPHVLWAHRTTPMDSHGETPFSLTCGMEAMIPTEIGSSSQRTKITEKENEENLKLNLSLLEERREMAIARETKYKKKVERYYNTRVKGKSFRPGE